MIIEQMQARLENLRAHAANLGAYERYDALGALFTYVIDEATADSTINFSGPFAKTTYLLDEVKAPAALRRAVNALRIRCRRHGNMAREELEAHFEADAACMDVFVRALGGEAVEYAPSPARQGGEKVRRHYLRVLVTDVGDDYITGLSEEDDGEPLRLRLRDTQKYLTKIVRRGDSLNLVGYHYTGNTVEAELIVYQPDYLVNVTQITQCFEHYGADARLSIIKRLMPPTNSEDIMLGNFASQMLDEQLHRGEVPYAESVRRFFADNAVALATCDVSADFHRRGQRQRANIEAALCRHLPETVGDFERTNVMVEPVFFAESLGLQARMDFLQLDGKVLLEQKSGKGGWPQNDFSVPRYREPHLVQLLLYMALIRYNFPSVYEANDKRLTAFLMYSQYSRPLIAPGYAPALVEKAMQIRNEIVWYQERLAEGDTDFLYSLSAEDLAPDAHGPLWERFSRPKLEEVLSPLRNADASCRAYHARMLRFVAQEHVQAKMGNKSKSASGFAALWNNSLSDKLDAGNIYAELKLCEPVAADDGSVSELVLTFHDNGTHAMANFRTGDTVVLYSYRAGTEPDARSTTVFRSLITGIGTDEVRLRLRFPQSGTRPFRRSAGTLWAIEHDFVDSSFNGLYQGIQAFLTMPAERRELLLLQREPTVDPSARLRLDHGSFNELATRVKQARELFLIVGPPGTGKTSYGLMSTLREQIAEGGSRVLLLSYTNRAVDEICEKLECAGIEYLRVGPELSCAPQFRHRLLCKLAAACARAAEVRTMLAEARVVVATTSSLNAMPSLVEGRGFDLAIIDEASQIIEPQLLQMLSATDEAGKPGVKKMVMIGDHKQLPAVVQQTRAQSRVEEPLLHAAGLRDCRESLFERLLRRFGKDPAVTYMLSSQGRMHADIAGFASEAFYGGRLTPVPLGHQLAPLEGRDDTVFSRSRVVFFDVSEEALPGRTNKVNEAEAALIGRLATEIYHREPEFAADTLGVIVPYRNQITAVRRAFEATGISALADVTVDTVERFQGSQRKYIIYGFTVKEPSQLRFLTEHTFSEDGLTIDRKLNVALTRAREYMVLTGNAALLRQAPVLRSLLEHITCNHYYRTM